MVNVVVLSTIVINMSQKLTSLRASSIWLRVFWQEAWLEILIKWSLVSIDSVRLFSFSFPSVAVKKAQTLDFHFGPKRLHVVLKCLILVRVCCQIKLWLVGIRETSNVISRCLLLSELYKIRSQFRCSLNSLLSLIFFFSFSLICVRKCLEIFCRLEPNSSLEKCFPLLSFRTHSCMQTSYAISFVTSRLISSLSLSLSSSF